MRPPQLLCRRCHRGWQQRVAHCYGIAMAVLWQWQFVPLRAFRAVADDDIEGKLLGPLGLCAIIAASGAAKCQSSLLQ